MPEYEPEPKLEPEPLIMEHASPSKIFLDKKRYLRTPESTFPPAPSLASYDINPYAINPKDSISRLAMEERMDKSRLASSERVSPFSKDPGFINVDKSPELGDLGQFAEDNEMYHPQMYDDDEYVNKKPAIKILGDDVRGQGVFDKGEDIYETRRENQFVPSKEIENSQSAFMGANR